MAAAAAAAIPQAESNNSQMNILNTLNKVNKVSRKIDYEAVSKIWTEGGKGFAMGGSDDNLRSCNDHESDSESAEEFTST